MFKIFKYFIYVILIFALNLSINPDPFFFDNLNWEKEKTIKNIIIYSFKNSDNNISYKAETIIKNFNAELIYNTLLDFKNYPYIFPRTITFEKKSDLNNNKYLFYSIMNFSPFKNRDYFIEVEYYTKKIDNENNVYILQWGPYEEADKFKVSDDMKRIKKIYSRWTVKKLKNNQTYISVEYHNDFEVNAPINILNSIKKNSTAKAIDNLLNYILNNKIK
jgi:hypothetical protein